MWRIKIENRAVRSYKLSFLTGIVSVFLGVIFTGIIFALWGVNPLFAFYKIFSGSFGSVYGWQETITKAIPLILISSGLSMAFVAGLWNIGAEGQMLLGAIPATYIALKLGCCLPAGIVIPLMFIAGFVGGALAAGIAAVLKEKFRINEVISTLMFNYIIAELVQYLVYGPWKGKGQWGFPYTDNFPSSATLSVLGNTRIHYQTLIIAVLAAVIVYILMKKTRFGYDAKVVGANPSAARYAGINFFRNSVLIMLISGGLAGIAGVGEVAGIHKHLTYPWTISAGYGFTAIIVAALAKNNPLVCLLISVFFSGILVGGDTIQTSLQMPSSTINIFNGIILFFAIAGDYFLTHSVRIVKNG
ncbi:MAG: beta-methylgalactoside transporter inner membrane component [Elusimicrobia bacterium ADurb.Bin231]|nr:MAG: beta-methylgalactoside transporter inner membrane component [Elusimicrobia bacterium ADurb.Bin231]